MSVPSKTGAPKHTPQTSSKIPTCPSVSMQARLLKRVKDENSTGKRVNSVNNDLKKENSAEKRESCAEKPIAGSQCNEKNNVFKLVVRKYDVLDNHTSQDSSQNATKSDWSVRAGEFFTLDSALVTTVCEGEDVDAVYADGGEERVLFHLRCNAISKENVDASWDALLNMAKTSQNNNRGIAAGKLDLEQIKRFRPKFVPSRVTAWRAFGSKPDGTPSQTHIANFANSSVMGWTDTRLRGPAQLPCRLTKFSATQAQKYADVFPLLHQVDALFAQVEPERYRKQLERAQQTVANIDSTAFSTVTVNYDFRTALHQDAGDFREGFGVLLAIYKPHEPEEGCELILPEFRVAVRLRSRDVLFFDTHQWHCNAPLTREQGVHRLSLVCYLREKLLFKCPHGDSSHDVAHDSHKDDDENGEDGEQTYENEKQEEELEEQTRKRRKK